MSLILPISLASTLAALVYVDMQYKAEKKKAEEEEGKKTGKKQLRLALMGLAVVICLVMIYTSMNKRIANSSFENRVAHAANTLRSSMKFQPQSSMKYSDEQSFAERVKKSAAALRKRISTPQQVSPEKLAARASAEISQFIADHS